MLLPSFRTCASTAKRSAIILPLSLRRLHGPAQPTRQARRGGGAAGPDGVIVHPTEDPAAGQSYTTGRDATASGPRSRSAISSRGKAAYTVAARSGRRCGFLVMRLVPP